MLLSRTLLSRMLPHIALKNESSMCWFGKPALLTTVLATVLEAVPIPPPPPTLTRRVLLDLEHDEAVNAESFCAKPLLLLPLNSRVKSLKSFPFLPANAFPLRPAQECERPSILGSILVASLTAFDAYARSAITNGPDVD
jgi:hypothetical protein